MSVVVRFAPSPTGHLHLGGVRTALFNWLFGRQRGGSVRLRLEDTDRSRSSDVHAGSILEALEWLGLDWDGPVLRQSERSHLYEAALGRLEEEGRVYRCYCRPDDLAKAREKARALGRTWKYPRICRDRAGPPEAGAPSVLRLRLPEAGPPLVEDLLLGSLHGAGGGLDDFVLTRSDGSALYNLCCVVDDAEMGVTHVVRGADHVENTLKQAALYEWLGLERPVFAHLPLVKGMSKRLGSASVQSFRERGYLPEALVNYVARLGWSHGDQEIFMVGDLLEHFALEQVGRSPGTVNEDKLLWLNEQHLRRASGERLAALVADRAAGHLAAGAPRLAAVADLLKPRVKTVVELAEAARPYLSEDHLEMGAAPAKGAQQTETERALLAELAEELEGVDKWEDLSIEAILAAFREARGLKLAAVAMPCRRALTGRAKGPKVVDIMTVLGRDSVMSRLRRATSSDRVR